MKGPKPTPPAPSFAGHQPPARRDPGSQVPSSAAVATPGGPGFTLPEPSDPPAFDRVRCCGGKSLNDGVAAACGRWFTHYPHALDREPGAL